jgi:hypothetical protein
MPQIPVRARISVGKPIHSHQDASATSEVLEAIDPVAEFVSLLNAHAHSVAHKLRMGQWAMVTSNVELNGRHQRRPARRRINHHRLAGRRWWRSNRTSG